MKILVNLLILLATSTMASAQPVMVRTGEHADFTRVVLTIPQEAVWSLGRDASGYVLQLQDANWFDIRRFYDLIPPERITAVSQDAEKGQLRLAVDCICKAEAFIFRSNYLVIDISDGPPAPGSPYEATLLSPDATLEARGFDISSDPFLPIILVPAMATPSPTDPATVATVSVGVNPDPPTTSNINADLSALEQAVTESLARGLSQGLLQMNATPNTSSALASETFSREFSDVENPTPGIAALTSLDSAAIPPDPVASVTQTGGDCLPDAYFDVGSWGDDRPFQIQIGELRAQLTQEFDRTDNTDVMNLARRFIYFGFGREAIQVLQLDGVNSQERLYLVALARIIDGDPPEPGLFAGQVSCETSSALWAVLAQRDGALDAVVSSDAVLRNFKRLPLPLQSHLAPVLAERFVAIGDTYGASQVLAVSRTDPNRSIAADLAETALTRALGAPEDALAELAEIVSNHPRMTAEAMTEFLMEAVRNNMTLREEDFILADALRFENASLPVAGDLAVAQVRALLAMDHFAEARALTDAENVAIGAERLVILTEEYTANATARMPDATFLAFAFTELGSPLSKMTEDNLAQRLLDLGFPDRAAAILEGDDQTDREHLWAQIALARDDPDAALSALGTSEGAQAAALRRIAQDLATADALLPDTTIAETTDQTLWRRGAWDDLSRSDDPLLQAASVAVLNSETAELPTETPLAHGRALLDRSEQARAVLQDLMARFEAPKEF